MARKEANNMIVNRMRKAEAGAPAASFIKRRAEQKR